ncbi:NACHT domain-containing protein [Sphingomonas citri]
MKFDFSNDFEFEAFVRNIASKCWSATGYSGPITIDGKERDGILSNELQIFCIEVTVSRSSKHTHDSCAKLDSLIRRLRGMHPDKGVTAWYITRYEATGEQGAILAQQKGINHRTFDAFYAMMVDAKEYLLERPKKPFGSIRGYKTDRFDDELVYTATKIMNIESGTPLRTATIAKDMSKAPTRTLLVGEYGAGKSMALRDIFQRLSKQHLGGSDSQFPVYVNLRDHIEQYDPDECLRRHASSIGMTHPEKLTRAWRSGLIYLLLDGFDELAPRIATGSRGRAQDLRNSAISLVRRLIEETPKEGSIVLAGRNNYFDTDEELLSALGIKKGWKLLEINDLDDEDLARFIRDNGWSSGVPEWVPKKPLLISYVKQHGLTDNVSDSDWVDTSDPARGWDYLVDKICEREVNQVYIALDPGELRQIYGRMATTARRKSDPRGPLSFQDCKNAFISITGVEPEERSVTALLRLPGLSGNLSGVDTSGLERGSRYFIDPDLADVLSASDVEAAVKIPYDYQDSSHTVIHHLLGELGRSVVFNRLGSEAEALISEALRVFSAKHSDGAKNICCDLLSVVAHSSIFIPFKVDFSNLFLSELKIDVDATLSNLAFSSCAFVKIEIEAREPSRLPVFDNCSIETVIHLDDLSSFIQNELVLTNTIDQFYLKDITYTTLRNEGAPESFLDLVSIIDKVFIRSTSGRNMSAIFRGRPLERRASLESILENLQKNQWVHVVRRGGSDIVIPNGAKSAEAKSIITRQEFTHPFAA